MTCIVGLVDDDKVYLGADSFIGSCHSWKDNGGHKLFRLKDDFIIGCTSSYRMIDLLTYKLHEWDGLHLVPNPVEWMKTVFINKVKDLFKDEGFAVVENNVEEGGFFLVGFRGKLFAIASDYCVIDQTRTGEAMGSGNDAALGSLYTTKNWRMKPENRVRIALEAAEAVVPTVRRPFNIEIL